MTIKDILGTTYTGMVRVPSGTAIDARNSLIVPYAYVQ